jgi:DNA-binding beta-propeller fold protein YncE
MSSQLPRVLTYVLAALAAALTGCGHQAGEPSGAPGTTTTTTGLLPSGVPTEGSRPPAEKLPPAAEPRNAPSATASGRMVPVGMRPEGVAVDEVTRTVAVATRDPDQLVLLDADAPAITARVPLPGSARHVELAGPGGPVLVPVETANALVQVRLSPPVPEAIGPPIITGTSPHDAAAASNGTIFVGNELGGTISVLRSDRIVKVFTDRVQPAGLAAVGTAVGVLDARANTLTVYDAEKLAILGSIPAGAGPTHLVADRHGRMIATDTRADTVRVFDPLPTPHEIGNVPQPGGPYGIAYDHVRDRLWVASSGTNEVVGYRMTDQTPREVQRIPTVQNPYSLGVDPATGRLFVAGVTGGVLQVVDPGDTGG